MDDAKFPIFGLDARNLRVGLSIDGFNPHSSLSSKCSCWPVILVIYNLSLGLIMKRKYMMLTLLISEPNQPGNDIDVYLQPLMNKLKILWEGVSGVYDAFKNKYFTLRTMLFWAINDFSAYENLLGNIVKSYNACLICLNKIEPTRLVHSQKAAYTVHRRWIFRNHPYRRQKTAFDNQIEHQTALVPLTGEEVLSRMEQEVPEWPFKKMNPRPTYKGGEGEKRTCWKKKSIFFELEYLKHKLIRHCLDVMHIEKNVCDSILETAEYTRKNKGWEQNSHGSCGKGSKVTTIGKLERGGR